MDALVILSPREQEYLVRVIEGALAVRDTPGFFLWTQGQLQALLPHAVLVALQFDAAGAAVQVAPHHASVLDAATRVRLWDPAAGLAVRLGRAWLAVAGAPAQCAHPGAHGPLAAFQDELEREGYPSALVHGVAEAGGARTVFVLLGLPSRPGPRQAYFLALVLPHLHLALLRCAAAAAPAGTRPMSAREQEILRWVGAGKSNAEIGGILGLSPLTVKNHLQRIYRTLGVGNRTAAVGAIGAPGVPARAAAPATTQRRAPG